MTAMGVMVARVGFEPTKHYAQNLKSCPFDQTRVSRIIECDVGNALEKEVQLSLLTTKSIEGEFAFIT